MPRCPDAPMFRCSDTPNHAKCGPGTRDAFLAHSFSPVRLGGSGRAGTVDLPEMLTRMSWLVEEIFPFSVVFRGIADSCTKGERSAAELVVEGIYSDIPSDAYILVYASISGAMRAREPATLACILAARHTPTPTSSRLSMQLKTVAICLRQCCSPSVNMILLGSTANSSARITTLRVSPKDPCRISKSGTGNGRLMI